jgi:hypothetical protein
MTTYRYKITLSDGEMIAVAEAIDRYRRICKEELVNGARPPYWAHLSSLESVLARLYTDAQMMSTSSSCWPNRTDSDSGTS